MITYPERKLAESMRNYINPANSSYDRKFREALERIVATKPNDAGPRKQMILDFILLLRSHLLTSISDQSRQWKAIP